MAVNVATHVAVLDRNGAVFLPNDGVTPVTLSSAPASGSRWSVIYARQRETEAPFSDSVNGPIIDKVESTTSETAARALLPAGALEIGVAKVDAGSANTNAGGVTITETVPYTAMEGGRVLLRSQDEQDAWNPHDGSEAYRLDLEYPLDRVDGEWVPRVRVATFDFTVNQFTDATLAGSALPVTDVTAETNDSAFITARTGTVFTLDRGTYTVAADFRLSHTPAQTFTGRTFVEIVKPSSITRNNSVAGEDTVGTSTTVHIPNDGGQIKVQVFKTSGGNHNITGRIAIVKSQ
jgi:hypothetical protein